MKNDETGRKRTLVNTLGIMVLALLMLVSIAGANPYAYIPNFGSNNVSVIDTATNTVTASVPVGLYPYAVAVNSAGTKVYVANYGSDTVPGTVSVIDTATNTVTATVPVGKCPVGIAVNPAGTRVYVSNQASHDVSVIDTATNTVIDTVNLVSGSHEIIVNPKGTKVYVAMSNNNISIIDTATNTVTATIPLDNHPYRLALNPAGTKLYVTAADNIVGHVYVIDTSNNDVVATVNFEENPSGIVVNPEGTIIYVAIDDGVYVDTIVAIDTATNDIISRVKVGSDPLGISITPDGKMLYVTNAGNHNVSVIDTATNTVIATVNVGQYPFAIGKFIASVLVKPVLPVANFSSNVTTGNSPLSVKFTDLSVDATSWNWDFGDGSTSIEQSPVHTYSTAGTYNVNLTAINSNGRNSKTAIINVLTPPPTINSIAVPLDPVPVGTSIAANANVTYLGSLNDLTAEWDWGDGSTSESQVSSNFATSHVYNSAGVYTVTFTLKDKNGGIYTQTSPNSVVVYDPEGGFVTGGGWIYSPAGAYVADDTLEGKATFGFVSKYQKGATVPSGNTEFQFKVADLNFKSTSYDWLVIAGPQAKYKGTGTINGEGNYGFMLSAFDGAIKGDGTDKFRMKIWDKESESTIYDNEIEAAEDEEPSTAISGGSIVIHKEK